MIHFRKVMLSIYLFHLFNDKFAPYELRLNTTFLGSHGGVGGGLVVGVLVFYFDNPSLNPSKACNFYSV